MHTITTSAHADVYVTSPFAAGRIAYCYLTEEKKEAIQVTHEVEANGPSEESACIVVDFPVRTYEDMLKVMEKIGTDPAFDIEGFDCD